MPADREPSSTSRFDQQHRITSRSRRSVVLAIISWSATALAATGSLLSLVRGSGVQIDPPVLGSKPALGYLVVALAVFLVAAVPLVRPLTLALRWLRMGDYRFAAAAFGVAAVMIVAALLK